MSGCSKPNSHKPAVKKPAEKPPRTVSDQAKKGPGRMKKGKS